MKLNREILRIAIPAILSNITVPLLGLCDTTIAGHLGNSAYIAAIAVGTMMINVVFWCFGFLRMGTTGLTAQAFGRGDRHAQSQVFSRAFLLGAGAGVLILLLLVPLRELVIAVIRPDVDVRRLASDYFTIVIWGAPAMLATMAVSGWFLGMQTSAYPMIIAVSTNIINIVVSVCAVYLFDMGFAGTAVGTLVANWCGLVLALCLVMRFNGGHLPFCNFREVIQMQGLGRFFKVNGDIFFRSFCIMSVSMGVSAIGARLGSDTLAVNAVMMQFFVLFSYFMDGFAFSGEALSGKAVGANDPRLLRQTVRRLLLWGLAMAVSFTIMYILFYRNLGSFITDNESVLESLEEYRCFLFVIPLITVAAFIYDGIYIGLTSTRTMLIVTLIAGIVFFMVNFIHFSGLRPSVVMPDNSRLWISFLSYLLTRGAGLALLYPRQSRRRIVKYCCEAG